MTKPRDTDLHVDFGHKTIIYRYFVRVDGSRVSWFHLPEQEAWCRECIGTDRWYYSYETRTFYFRKKSYLTMFLLRWNE